MYPRYTSTFYFTPLSTYYVRDIIDKLNIWKIIIFCFSINVDYLCSVLIDLKHQNNFINL